MVEFGEKDEREDELERELRAALRLLPAPEGFANRVIARSRELSPARTLPFAIWQKSFSPVLRWSVAAVLLLAVTLGGLLQHHRQRVIAGERARQQVLLALRITSFTLQAVRNRVDRSNNN